MQRTITTFKVNLMKGEVDEKGEPRAEFTTAVIIANSAEDARKEVKKSFTDCVLVGISEPETHLYKLDDYEFLKLATVAD